MLCEDVECVKNAFFEGYYATIAPLYNRNVMLHQKKSCKSSDCYKRYFKE